MPFVLIEPTLRYGVERGAPLDGDIGDGQTLVVQREMAVDGLGEDAVAVVEEEYKEQDDGCEEAELDARANLRRSAACSMGGRGERTSRRVMISSEIVAARELDLACSHDGSHGWCSV